MQDMSQFTVEDFKAQAKRLRRSLETDGTIVGHSQALELIARQYGYRDWNTLHAVAASNRPKPPLAVGSRVMGRYLGQLFTGEVVGLQTMADGGAYRLTLHFDEPVDVVTFDSFSAFRQRVTCTIGRDGCSPEKTSNGKPHMELHLE